MNRRKPTPIVEYLAYLSVKHSIYLAELFQALVIAREHGTTKCQELTIEYRGSIKNEAIFLITKSTTVLGQFRVDEDFLFNKNIRFENWMDTDKIRRQIERQNLSKPLRSVQDLRHGMKKVNFQAKVFQTTKPLRVFTQYGNSATVTNAVIGDDTGRIKLCLWGDQANLVSLGDKVQITNANISTFKGERQVRLGKNSTVTILESSKTKLKNRQITPAS